MGLGLVGFKPSKDRYKLWRLLMRLLFHFVSNPQRIATNIPSFRKIPRSCKVSNPQRIATNTYDHSGLDGPQKQFQTLKGSLQTKLHLQNYENFIKFQTLKGSLQTRKFVFLFPYLFSVSNPQRIATNTCVLISIHMIRVGFKPSKDRYKLNQRRVN